MTFSTYNRQLPESQELTEVIAKVQVAYDTFVAARSSLVVFRDRLIEMKIVSVPGGDSDYEKIQALFGFESNTHAHQTFNETDALAGHISADPATKPVGQILAAMNQWLDRLPKP